MAIYTALIALLALANAWLAGMEQDEILHWTIVLYWVMVTVVWGYKAMMGG